MGRSSCFSLSSTCQGYTHIGEHIFDSRLRGGRVGWGVAGPILLRLDLPHLPRRAHRRTYIRQSWSIAYLSQQLCGGRCVWPFQKDVRDASVFIPFMRRLVQCYWERVRMFHIPIYRYVLVYGLPLATAPWRAKRLAVPERCAG